MKMTPKIILSRWSAPAGCCRVNRLQAAYIQGVAQCSVTLKVLSFNIYSFSLYYTKRDCIA